MHSGREPGCTVALAPLSPAAGAARSRPPRLPATCCPRALRAGRGRRRRCSASPVRCRAAPPLVPRRCSGQPEQGCVGTRFPGCLGELLAGTARAGAAHRGGAGHGGAVPTARAGGAGCICEAVPGPGGSQPWGVPGPPRGAGTPSPQEVGGEATALPRSSGGQTGRCRVMFLTVKLKTKLQGGCRAVKLGGIVPHRLPGRGAGGGWQIPSIPCPRLRAPAALPGTVPSIPLFRMVSPSAPVFRFFPGSFI